MKYIPLTKGKRTLVDDGDYKWLMRWKWYYGAALPRRTGYASRRYLADGLRKTVLMARLIVGAKRGEVVDHANGDTLDNRRSNLRICTIADNQRNQGRRRDNTSGFKGVSWLKARRKWAARVQFNGRPHHIGLFTSAEEAARAYDLKARELFGEFARPNFPDERLAA